MASLFLMGAGALINAISFSATNYLFNKLSSHSDEERKRHDLAVEKLQKARDEWAKQRQKKIDLYNQALRDQNSAQQMINDVDEAGQAYFLATGIKQEPFPPKPVLSDYYHPSQKQKEGEIVFITGCLAALGYVTYKYL